MSLPWRLQCMRNVPNFKHSYIYRSAIASRIRSFSADFAIIWSMNAVSPLPLRASSFRGRSAWTSDSRCQRVVSYKWEKSIYLLSLFHTISIWRQRDEFHQTHDQWHAELPVYHSTQKPWIPKDPHIVTVAKSMISFSRGSFPLKRWNCANLSAVARRHANRTAPRSGIAVVI